MIKIYLSCPVLLKYPFLKAEKKPVLKLNTKLIEQDKLMDGIKES